MATNDDNKNMKNKMKIIILLIVLLIPLQMNASALNFTTAGSEVNFGSSSTLDDLGAFTYALWLRVNVMPSNIKLEKGAGGQDSRRYLEIFGNPGGVQVRIDNGGGGVANDGRADATNAYIEDEWTFLVGTFSGNTGTAPKVYKGTLLSTVSELSYSNVQNLVQLPSSNASLDQFIHNTTANPQDVDVAWVGVWNKELSLGELRTLQFRPVPTAGNVLFTYLGFNGTGIQPDWSGNGNNGTVTNATLSLSGLPLRNPFGF